MTEEFQTHIEIKRNEDGEYVEQHNVPFSIGFVNPFIAANKTDKDVKAFLAEHVGDKYKVWTTELSEMPEFFSRHPVDDIRGNTEIDFFNGYSVAQYLQSKSEGGVHINPVFQGMYNDAATWRKFLSRHMNAETVFYIDVPYEFYKKTTKSFSPVPEDKYNQLNRLQKQFVDSIHELNKQEIH